jgi:UPF0042 nucleotide-binding protein
VRLLPYYAEQGKHRLCVSFGCTGGQHRSVCIAQQVWARLKESGLDARLEHRDLDK